LAGPTVFAVVGALYVGALFPYFALLRNETDGVSRLIFILLLVIAGDSAAYFVGSNIGRIKIAPAVSPGKTLEGSIASIAGSIVAALVLRSVFVPDLNFGLTVQLGALVNIAAQVGDLAESALKRIARVKDSGWIFPGHGGLLDRADSLVFAAVFSYYFFSAMRPFHAPR
jgi:phosphatidate cytidylyltransferase